MSEPASEGREGRAAIVCAFLSLLSLVTSPLFSSPTPPQDTQHWHTDRHGPFALLLGFPVVALESVLHQVVDVVHVHPLPALHSVHIDHVANEGDRRPNDLIVAVGILRDAPQERHDLVRVVDEAVRCVFFMRLFLCLLARLLVCVSVALDG